MLPGASGSSSCGGTISRCRVGCRCPPARRPARPRAAASQAGSAGARPRCRPAERRRPARARCRRRCWGAPGDGRAGPARLGAAIGPGSRPGGSHEPEREQGRGSGEKQASGLHCAPIRRAGRCSYPCTGLCCATLCVVLAPSARSRGARWRSASPLHWCGTGCGCARRWCRRSRGRRPPRSLSQPPAPRCETRGSTRSRCGRTSPTSTCPTTTRRRSCGASGSTIRSRSTACSGSAPRPRSGCSARWPREGHVGPLEYGLSAVHWSWFLIPHGTCAYILLRHRRYFERSAFLMAGVLRPRLHRLLGAAHRSALVGGRAGQAAAGPPDHGRGRRALLGTSLGAAIPFTAREPICRDALTPLRYVRDGSAPAQPDRTGARRGGLDLRTDARLRARLPRASTTWLTCSRAWRCRRPCGGSRPGSARSRGRSAWSSSGSSRGRPDAHPRAQPAQRAGPGSPPDARASRTTGTPATPRSGRSRRCFTTGASCSAGCCWSCCWSAAIYLLFPKVVGIDDAMARFDEATWYWVVIAVGFNVLAFAAYVALFRGVLGGVDLETVRRRLDWRASYQITMAGLAATRIFSAAGAGGIVLTYWALKKAGLPTRRAACRMVAFLALMYGVYTAALVIFGILLRTGVFPGEAPFGGTVVPAVVAARGDGRVRADGAHPPGLGEADRLLRRRLPAPALPPPAGQGAGHDRHRRSHGDRVRPAPERRRARGDRRGGLLGGEHRRALGELRGVRRQRGVRGPRPGLLRRAWRPT